MGGETGNISPWTQTHQTIQGIPRNSVDYYSSLRNFYRQFRNAQIRNGRNRTQNLPCL